MYQHDPWMPPDRPHTDGDYIPGGGATAWIGLLFAFIALAAGILLLVVWAA